MGDDGTPNSPVAKDAYAFTLHYFDENGAHDYAPIGAAQSLVTSMPTGFGFTSLFNGNIAAMSVNVPKAGEALLYSYRYDQLNRLISMDAYKGLNPNTNSWKPIAIDDYKENITYDPNGNILTYGRNGDAARISMDNLTYTYKTNTNQLDKVAEAATDANITEYDKYNDIKQGQTSGNYKYDAIGNMTSDASEGISNIDWTVYGKIKSITKTGSDISYSYDASGNRISKDVDGKETWYVRDASGNIMSVYSKDASVNAGHLTQSEISLYGSSRLGVLNLANDVQSIDGNSARIYTFTRGNKFFELSNHLGNVLATISDKRILHSSDGTTVDYYQPELVSAQDYYPFGMLMPGRKYSIANTNYRYGFNGKENDKDIENSAQDYGMRVYDGRLGKFLSVDPLTQTYPWYTPYQFAGDKPIWATDVDGLEENTTSTYVYHPPVVGIKLAFRGIITITNATSQIAHKIFQGDFGKLAKTDPSKYSLRIVNSLVGSKIGTEASRLDITMTGTRSQVSKSWKGTDIKYFTQYSYSFTSNNVVEKGTFELQNGQIQASARAWDPLTFLLLNKVVSSVVVAGAGAIRTGTTTAGKAIVQEEMITLYRSISKAEAEGIQATGKLSFAEGQMEVKQFWRTTEGLDKFNKSGFGGEYNLEMTVPKSLIGNGKALNTSTQVDEFFGPTATVDGAAELNTVNQSAQSFKITPIKK